MEDEDDEENEIKGELLFSLTTTLPLWFPELPTNLELLFSFFMPTKKAAKLF